jgi:hypothetical protein
LFKQTITNGLHGLENDTSIKLENYKSQTKQDIIINDNVYRISEVVITNSRLMQTDVEKIFSTSRIINLKKRKTSYTKNVEEESSQKSNSDDVWIPDAYGYSIKASTSYPGKRYLKLQMIWITSDPFGEWSDNVTFEPDFNLNNSSGSSLGPGTYLDDSEYLNGVPNVHYAASSLPMAYLDTRDTDANYIKTFTIGCPDASEITSFKNYINYIVTDIGDADVDNGQVISQRGQRYPSNVYNTWSVFNTDFYIGGVKVVDIDNEVPGYRPFGSGWPVSVPGSGTWYK